jgi:hemerythrin
MPLILWNDSFSVYDSQMDAQHRAWFDILNRFHEKCETGGSTDELARLLDEAIAYSHYHFVAEENYLHRIGYAQLGDQHRKH